MVEVAAPLWQAALEDAINRMAVFRGDADKRVNLSVKILAIDMPAFGASMTTKSAARYELIDRANSDIIFTQDIATDGVVPFDCAFVGVVRARESLNRSVQQNIAQFLQALETIDVSKPMFPAKVATEMIRVLLFSAVILLAGCAANISPNTYSVRPWGR